MTLNILLLEDNPDDAEMVRRLLSKADPQYLFCHVMNKQTYLQALVEFHPDVILSDNNLPQFSAPEALEIIQERGLMIPFILVTGTVSDEFAANIIKSGADDYILKDRLTRLPVAINVALKQRRLEREKQDAIQKLVQSERNYRTIFLKSPLPKWIYDLETLGFLDVNEEAISRYGYSLEEFLGMTVTDIVSGEDQEKLLMDPHGDDEPDTMKRIRVHLKKNGQRIIVETTAHEIDYNSRKARLVVSYDITERLETERQKEFDRNNLAALINNTDDLMWSVDNDLRLITCNDSFSRTIERACGRPLTKGDRILSLPFPKEQTTRYQGFYDRALSGESFTIIERFDSPFQFWSEISFYPIGRAGSVIGTACFSRDITERRKAEEEMRLMEKELLDQKVEEQKKVTRAIIKGQEKERDHIGQELHDNVNQILVGTKMYLNMAGGKNEELKEMIRYPLELIDASIQEIRVLTSRYVTPMKDIDLQELLQGLMDKLKDASSVAIEFDYFVTSDIEDELKLNIYRIIQEQINNVVKHAEATHLNVTVKGDCNFIDIAVADDGKGFDPATKRKGIGISNMTNRVESFNGEIHIESAPGKGCRTSIRIPH